MIRRKKINYYFVILIKISRNFQKYIRISYLVTDYTQFSVVGY